MNILADTCFWISLCDSSENDHQEVQLIMERIMREKIHSILVPHPVLYETLRTEMVKKHEQVLMLARYFDSVIKVPDTDYIYDAYRLIEQQARQHNGSASMVDITIMLMAEDVRNNVKAILTRNGRDFASFCQKKGIVMIQNMTVFQAI